MVTTVKKVQALNLPLIPSIRKYAEENTSYGWDLIVECWTDEDILLFLGKVDRFPKAITKIGRVVTAHRNYAYEIENA